MPADFDKCENEGGKIITKRINSMEYMHVCIDHNGKSHAGYPKKYKKLTGRKSKSMM